MCKKANESTHLLFAHIHLLAIEQQHTLVTPSILNPKIKPIAMIISSRKKYVSKCVVRKQKKTLFMISFILVIFC